MTSFNSQDPLSYAGLDRKKHPKLIKATRDPGTSDNTQDIGTRWFNSTSNTFFDYVGSGTWQTGGNAVATTTDPGIVTINEDGTLAGADNTTVPTSLAVKTYADALAIAGAPDASTTVKGLVEIATDAEAVAGTGTGGTGAILAVTPSNLTGLFAAAPAIGGTTPAAGTFTTLAATGAVDFDAGGSWESGGANDIDIGADANTDAINIGTGAAARTVTIGNGSGATSVVLNSGTGAINIGTNAVAHTVTIGNVTGASAVALNAGTGGIALASTGTGDITINSDDTLLLDADGVLELNSSAGAINIGNDADAFAINVGTGAAARSITIGNVTGATGLTLSVGTGNFALDGVTNSTYNIGASTTTGTVTIGGTSQTGNFVLNPSDGAVTTTLANGNGTKTINIGNGIDGNTISAGNGANTSAQIINLAAGASGANSTVNVLSGNGTAGTQTLNVLTGNRAGALNLATGAAAHVIAVGSASAGAVTVDTAAGISLDAATASNFTVSGATEDLTLTSSGGRIVVTAGEDAADAIYLRANAGISETIRLHSDQGTGAASVHLESDVGGVTLTSGLASSDAINLSATAGGVDVDAALDIVLTSTENAADSIYLHANGGISETIRLHSDQGTGAASVHLESDVGGVTLTSGLASADAINLNATAGGVDIDGALQVNIASSQADAGAITLSASNASGGITHTGRCVYTPDSITSDNAGVAASVSTPVTLITTDGDSNEDNVTLADGVAGQIKHFAVVAAGNAADSVKITPANMAGGTKITFAADPTGLGCSMVFDGTNWTIFANNGGTIA